jgi:hypothetical protein
MEKRLFYVRIYAPSGNDEEFMQFPVNATCPELAVEMMREEPYSSQFGRGLRCRVYWGIDQPGDAVHEELL